MILYNFGLLASSHIYHRYIGGLCVYHQLWKYTNLKLIKWLVIFIELWTYIAWDQLCSVYSRPQAWLTMQSFTIYSDLACGTLHLCIRYQCFSYSTQPLLIYLYATFTTTVLRTKNWRYWWRVYPGLLKSVDRHLCVQYCYCSLHQVTVQHMVLHKLWLLTVVHL
jgi:hypothetical protein